MARKKKIAEEQIALQEKLNDLQSELDEIETNRVVAFDNLKAQVGEDYFCGVVLDLEGIFSVLKLMLETGKQVKIPFNLYLKED